jgi:hypothetical protein
VSVSTDERMFIMLSDEEYERWRAGANAEDLDEPQQD